MTTTTTETKVIYTTACGMFRVVEKNGAFYPQERIVGLAGFGRIRNEQAMQQAIARNQEKVYINPWEGWHLGYTTRRENKGYKNYKSVQSAIKFVDFRSELLQDA